MCEVFFSKIYSASFWKNALFSGRNRLTQFNPFFSEQKLYFFLFSFYGYFFYVFIFLLDAAWLPLFFITYFVHLVPFFIVNSILTGTFTDKPIVWYNNTETLSVRIGTIPLEDFFMLFYYF